MNNSNSRKLIAVLVILSWPYWIAGTFLSRPNVECYTLRPTATLKAGIVQSELGRDVTENREQAERTERAKRLSQNMKEKFFFKYGRLADEHPVSVYMRALLENILGREANEYNVVVSPDWRQINAFTLPDGTIIVSLDLLKFLKYREELEALLAHEVIHIKQKHAEIIDTLIRDAVKTQSLDIDTILIKLGIRRLQEYEADLRWVFEEFEKRNINPLGLKLFLERLDAYEKSRPGYKSVSTEYGCLEDRALNIESIWYFIDIASLSHELNELPDEFKKRLEAIPPSDRSDFWLGLTFLGGEELKKRVQQRLATAKKLPVSQLVIGLNAILELSDERREVFNRYKDKIQKLNERFTELDDEIFKLEKRGAQRKARRKRQDADDIQYEISRLKDKVKVIEDELKTNEKIISILAKRVDEELFSRENSPDAKRRSLTRGLFYELYCGLEYFIYAPLESETLNKRQEQDNKNISTVEDIELLIDIIADPRLHSLPVPNIAKSPVGFVERLLVFIIKEQRLDSRPTNNNVSDYMKTALSLADAVKRLYKAKGIDTIKAQDIFNNAIDLLLDKLPTRYTGLRQKARDEALRIGLLTKESLKEPDRLTRVLEERAEEICTDIFRKIEGRERFQISRHRDTLRRITDVIETYELDSRGICSFFQILGQVKYRPKADSDKAESDEAESDKWRTTTAALLWDTPLVKDAIRHYILFRLFEIVVERCEQFKTLSELEKRALLFNGLLGLAYPVVPPMELKINTTGALLLDERGMPYYSYAIKIEDGGEVETSLLQHNDEEYLAQKRTSIEERWLEPRWRQRQVIEIYHSLVESLFENRITMEYISKALFSKILARYLTRYKDWDSFFKEVKALEKEGIPVTEIIGKYRGDFGVVLSMLWRDIPEEPSREQLEQVYKAIDFIDDPFLRLQFQAYYYEKLWPMLSFDEKLDMLFSKAAGGFFDFRKFNDFIEQEAKTEEELHAALSRFKHEFDIFMKKGTRSTGLGAIFSNIRLSPEFSLKFIAALLKTWEQDATLRDVILQNLMEHSDSIKGAPLKEEDVVEYLKGFRDIGERITRYIYNIDESAKYLLLRRMLTGRGGLLSDPRYRAQFLSNLIEETVSEDKDEAGLRSIMSEVISALGSTDEWRPLYFSLQKLLLERMCIPPETMTLWEDTPSFKEYINRYLGREAYYGIEADKSEQRIFRKATKRGIFRIMSRKPWRYKEELLNRSELILRAELVKKGIIRPPEVSKRLPPLSFVIEFAQEIGALPVRFLQLLPQFVADLPDEYQDEFSRVYDSVYGQSKLAAVSVLEREWPAIWTEIASIEERVGGGSLMTVYRVKTHNGEDEVLKVLNTNLKYHLENSVNFLSRVLDELEELYGERYQIARLVVDEVREWIERDVDFEGFLEKDKIFRERNSGFMPEGFNYRIYVPRSKGPQSRYFMREEYIEGLNLTEWRQIEEDGHNMKEIVSLITKNYLKQLREGFVHSDVHIANFRVTADNKVAVLDRNLFLELTPRMKELVDILLNPMQLFQLSPEVLFDRLFRISEVEVSARQRKQIIRSLADFMDNIRAGNYKGIGKLMVTLRQNGLKLPIELTLVFKNINSLQQMAKRAGFNNIVEAYLYTGSGRKVRSGESSHKPTSKTISHTKPPSATGRDLRRLDTLLQQISYAA